MLNTAVHPGLRTYFGTQSDAKNEIQNGLVSTLSYRPENVPASAKGSRASAAIVKNRLLWNKKSAGIEMKFDVFRKDAQSCSAKKRAEQHWNTYATRLKPSPADELAKLSGAGKSRGLSKENMLQNMLKPSEEEEELLEFYSKADESFAALSDDMQPEIEKLKIRQFYMKKLDEKRVSLDNYDQTTGTKAGAGPNVDEDQNKLIDEDEEEELDDEDNENEQSNGYNDEKIKQSSQKDAESGTNNQEKKILSIGQQIQKEVEMQLNASKRSQTREPRTHRSRQIRKEQQDAFDKQQQDSKYRKRRENSSALMSKKIAILTNGAKVETSTTTHGSRDPNVDVKQEQSSRQIRSYSKSQSATARKAASWNSLFTATRSMMNSSLHVSQRELFGKPINIDN
jgi:hypothetical protein